MRASDLAAIRLARQHISGSSLDDPADVVRWMGAVQAQDYPAAVWGIGLRTTGASAETVERAITRKKIVRTWPMRGTLHIIPAGDVRWMLTYLTPRIVARARHRFRQLRLGEGDVRRSNKLLAKALGGGKRLTRDAVYALLERNGISCAGQRGIHLLWRLAQEGLLCFGPKEGKQPTFVLLDDWVPLSDIPSREEALGELAQRYFVSHGPATVRDFAWWSGLTANEAAASVESARHKLHRERLGNEIYWMGSGRSPHIRSPRNAVLLPSFDEFLVSYKDRRFAIDQQYARRVHPGGGIFSPTIVVGTSVAGTWRRTLRRTELLVSIRLFTSVTARTRKAIVAAASTYAEFLGRNAKVLFES